MRLLLIAAVALLASAAQAQVDPQFTKELTSNAPGSGDQLLPRYAGSFILAQTKKDFDELACRSAPRPARPTRPIPTRSCATPRRRASRAG